MSAQPIPLCSTCLERPIRWGDECSTCGGYRRRHGEPRPQDLILAHLKRRSQWRGLAGASVLTELRSTMDEATPRITGGGLCVPCGTITSWVRGHQIPLCDAHLGSLALMACILDEPEERIRVMEAITA